MAHHLSRAILRMLGAAAVGAFIVASGSSLAYAEEVRNVVLVHGAFVDASIWDGVIRRLQRDGYEVRAVQLPLTSLAEDVAATQAVLRRVDGPTVLVGYSWGGVPVSVAGVDSKVKGLVYFAAVTPDPGQSLKQMLAPYAEKAMPGMAAVQRDDEDFLWLDPARFGFALAHDAPPDVVRVMAAAEKPTAERILSDKPERAAWQSKPTWYAVSTEDKIFPVQLQRDLARKIGARVIELPTGHASILSRPDDASALIENAAQTLSKR
jgi:pimeloyl-ACP methyl ester carboxylesterase